MTDQDSGDAVGPEAPPADNRIEPPDVPGPLLFTGAYELTVDDKGRILIPSDVRKELNEERDGKGLMLMLGQNGRPWFYAETYFRETIAPRSDDAVLDEDLHNYMLYVLSSARLVLPDKQNRIVLPDDDDYDRSGLGKEVVLAGVGNHLELWRRDDWKAHKAELRKRGGELAARFRQFQPPASLARRPAATTAPTAD